MGTRCRMAIIHIGLIKTGSTAIQLWLSQHRQPLQAGGVHYAAAFGPRDHHRLAHALRAAAASPDGPDGSALRHLLDAFTLELRALPANIQTVVVSSEHLSGLSDAAVRLLRDRMADQVGEVRIIAYLRRQDEFAISRFSNMLRAGRAPASPLAVAAPRYDELLSRWADVFGAAAIRPRIYAAGRLAGDDAVIDFREAAGIGAPAYVAPARRANPNLDPVAIGLLREVNNELQRQGLPTAETAKLRARLAGCLQAIAPGSGELPGRADIEAYLARCAEANEAVRRMWFPDLETLFPMDLSAYPDAAPSAPGRDDALALAVRCLVWLAGKSR